jgi:hypothetical protein
MHPVEPEGTHSRVQQHSGCWQEAWFACVSVAQAYLYLLLLLLDLLLLHLLPLHLAHQNHSAVLKNVWTDSLALAVDPAAHAAISVRISGSKAVVCCFGLQGATCASGSL